MKAALATVAALALLASAAFAGSDALLRQKIEAHLAKAGLDKQADITVTVEDGVARLTGIVLFYSDLREADRVARKEARSVVNELRVVPETPRSDSAVRKDALAAVLRWARYGAFDAVSVEVTDGVAALRGWVDTPLKKREVEDLLAPVEGLRDVHNDLRVQGFSSGDRRLLEEIHGKIYADPIFERWAGLPDPPVRVFVDRGHVTLAGIVGSRVEKMTADSIARATLAFSVNNQLVIESERQLSEDRKKDDPS